MMARTGPVACTRLPRQRHWIVIRTRKSVIGLDLRCCSVLKTGGNRAILEAITSHAIEFVREEPSTLAGGLWSQRSTVALRDPCSAGGSVGAS